VRNGIAMLKRKERWRAQSLIWINSGEIAWLAGFGG